MPDQNGKLKEIQAKFDPDFDPENKRMTDAGKIVFGNRMGGRKERRVTLDISEDAYDIIGESNSITNDSTVSEKHPEAKIWHYFMKDIMFKSHECLPEPYTVFIDVKETDHGQYIYSFYALNEVKAANLLIKIWTASLAV